MELVRNWKLIWQLEGPSLVNSPFRLMVGIFFSRQIDRCIIQLWWCEKKTDGLCLEYVAFHGYVRDVKSFPTKTTNHIPSKVLFNNFSSPTISRRITITVRVYLRLRRHCNWNSSHSFIGIPISWSWSSQFIKCLYVNF